MRIPVWKNIWKYRKLCREKLIDLFNIGLLFALASELCVMGNTIVINSSRIIRSEKLLELISRILFVVPWFMFKLDRVINEKPNPPAMLGEWSKQ